MPIQNKKSFYNKTQLFWGLIFLSAAFVCVAGVFYLMFSFQKAKARQMDTMHEQMVELNVQRERDQRKASELEDRVGRSFYLNSLISEAEKTYGDQEKNRKEGTLWIDRKAGVYYVTLGALQGLVPGSRVVIYDGNKKIGYVRVETPLDVISYVQPVNPSLDQLEKDYYRAVFE